MLVGILAITLVAAVAPAAPAKTATPAAAPTPAKVAGAPTPPRTPTHAPTPTESQVAAAKNLFRAMKLEETLPNTIAGMVEMQVSRNPAFAQYKDIMLGYLHKYVTWEAMEPDLIRLYTETYTESELGELAAFYATPVGQKMLAKMPDLTTRTAAIGAKTTQAHQAELTELLNARRQELEAQAATRTPGARTTPRPTPSPTAP